MTSESDPYTKKYIKTMNQPFFVKKEEIVLRFFSFLFLPSNARNLEAKCSKPLIPIPYPIKLAIIIMRISNAAARAHRYFHQNFPQSIALCLKRKAISFSASSNFKTILKPSFHFILLLPYKK